MDISIVDQRQGARTAVTVDPVVVEEYCRIAGIDLSAPGILKIRLRSDKGAYGFTTKHSWGYRVVVQIRNPKRRLSEHASYVVSNTLLHELRHVAQGMLSGWHALSPDYHGWSEVEAREYGKMIFGKGPFAIR